MKILFAILLLIPAQVIAKGTLDQAIIGLWGETNGKDVIWRCNTFAKNPKHCKITHSFVGGAESTFGQNATNHNIYGNSKYKFQYDWQAHKRFNQTYNRYYYKNLTPSDFYSNDPRRKPKTRYCMSEESSKSPSSCPNGFNTAWQIYNNLISIQE